MFCSNFKRILFKSYDTISVYLLIVILIQINFRSTQTTSMYYIWYFPIVSISM